MSNNTIHYKCTLKPTDIYFFGQDDRFADNETAPYYLVSKNKPSQLALLGVTRYLVLLNSNQLIGDENSTKEIREKLIGTYKPMQSGADKVSDNPFGVIKSISPLFIEKDGEMLIKTPLDHCNKEHQCIDGIDYYTPMKMTGVQSEYGLSIVPYNYFAKEGITSSYMDNKGKLYPEDKIFGYKELTRVARKRDGNGNLLLKDGAFFKKKYCHMDKNYSFVFYIEAEKDNLPTKGIVYMGQEKSSFEFEISEVNEKWEDIIRPFEEVISKGMTVEGYKKFYALSDFYIDKKHNKIKELISYSIATHTNAKFISDSRNSHNIKGENGVRRVIESSLYNFVNAGSVYFVKDERANEFKESIDLFKKLENTGLNYFIESEKEPNE